MFKGSLLLTASSVNHLHPAVFVACSAEVTLQALFNLGNLHCQGGEYQAAVQCYDSVLRLDDQHWRSMLNKAVALIGLHQDRAAQLSLKQAYQVSGAIGLTMQSHNQAAITLDGKSLSAACSLFMSPTHEL